MAVEWTSSVDLHVDVVGPGGRRATLERALREAIRNGRLRTGDRLPSTRALATDLGVARGTVTEAYAQLTAEGWLEARQGAATTVARAPGAPTPRPPARTVEARPRHDFKPGSPDLSGFPRQAWSAAIRQALRTLPDADLGYGDTSGHVALRSALAAYLGRARGVVTDVDHLLTSSGWTQALDLTCRVLAARGVRAVALEDPCSPHYRATVEAAGLEVVALPVDDDGARLEGLDGVGAVVLTPAHQYPAGPTLGPERRAAAIAWARDSGGLIIEDDYDGELRYDRQPVGALQALDPEHVVYVGTAAKSLAPGLRLGWMAVPSTLRDELWERKHLADRHGSVTDQVALAELITSGAYDRQLRRARLRYRRRRDLLLARLGETVPHLVPSGIAAGLHVVLDLDGGAEAPLVDGLAERGVRVGALGPSYHAEPLRTGLVIGYGTPPEHGFAAAVDALVAGLADLVRPLGSSEAP